MRAYLLECYIFVRPSRITSCAIAPNPTLRIDDVFPSKVYVAFFALSFLCLPVCS